MRIVLDENLPRSLKSAFTAPHQIVTVQELGLSGTTNGELLLRLEGQFDVFVTADKNLRYQQKFTGRLLAIVELPSNRLPLITAKLQEIIAAVVAAKSGEYIEVPSDHFRH